MSTDQTTILIASFNSQMSWESSPDGALLRLRGLLTEDADWLPSIGWFIFSPDSGIIVGEK